MTFEVGLSAVCIVILLQAYRAQGVECISLNVTGHHNLTGSGTIKRHDFLEWAWPCWRKCDPTGVGFNLMLSILPNKSVPVSQDTASTIHYGHIYISKLSAHSHHCIEFKHYNSILVITLHNSYS